MDREKIILGVCVILAATTVTAWVQNHWLQQENNSLRKLAIQSKPAIITMTSAPVVAPVVKPVDVVKTGTASDEAEQKALRDQIEDLQKQVAERDQRLAGYSDRVNTNRDEGRFRGGEGRMLREAELAELKEKDPERFQEIEKQRAEFRDRIKTAAGDQVSFLESVDISQWPADQQANHVRLLELAASFAAALEQGPEAMMAADEISRRQMFEKMHEAADLMEAERTMLLSDTARQMGFDEKGSKEFVDYIQTIQKVTSPRGFFPGRGGPPRQ